MKTYINLSLLSIIQLIISFLLQMFILNIFGMGAHLDIFIASNTLNYVLVTVATSILNFSLTPFFTGYVKKKRFKTFAANASTMVNLFFLLFLFLALLQAVFADPITRLLFPGFEGEDRTVLNHLFIFQAFISILTVLTGILTAFNYALNKLYKSVLSPVAAIIVQGAAVYFLHKHFGVYALPIALLINNAANLFVLSYGMFKYYSPKIALNTEIKYIFSRMFPLLFSSSFSKTDIVVDRYFTSQLTSGSLALLHYGQLFANVVSTFISKGISIVSLRKMSEMTENKERMHKYFMRLYKIVFLLSAAACIIIVFSGKWFLSLIVISGKISTEQIDSLYKVIVALLGVAVGGSLSSVLVNAFYANGLTGIVSVMGTSLHIIGIVTKVVFFNIYGFYSLPIVFSGKSILNTVILLVMYHFYINKISMAEFGRILMNLIIFVIVIYAIYYAYMYDIVFGALLTIGSLGIIFFNLVKIRREI